ncbi:MAG: four helix bundle protein [Bacteroidales bacterium]|nr:four helix bundle protein [Bacteroidales bacterium]
MIKSYKELIVWQKSISLVEYIYCILQQYPKDELYGIISQMKRASISIPSNISEGFGRHSKNDFAKFLLIARGSLFELQTQIELSLRLNFINKNQYDNFNSLSTDVEKLLNGLLSKIKFE